MDLTVIPVLEGYTAGDRFQNILWSVPITSANPAKAVEALNYIYAHDEAAWLLQYGIEGQDYEVIEKTDAGTKIKYLSDNPQTLPYYQLFGVYGDRLAWPVMDPTPIDMNQTIREFSDSIPDSRKSPALGYCFINDNVSAEYSAVSAVIQQYIPSVNCGTVDPATNLADFQSALKAAGIDTVIEERAKKKISWKRIWPFYLMALPGFLYMLINNYIPMFGISIAFKKLNFREGIWGSPWVGFKNFKFLFASADAWIITRNTILYNVAFFIVGNALAITIAILINEIQSRVAKKAYQSLILLPYLMSWVIVSYLAYTFLSAETGMFNKSILEPLGLEAVNWYQEKKYWPFILIFVSVWKSVGYSMIIYLSSVVGISMDYFEAAKIDGASKWQQIKYITLPLLKPTLITLFILSVGQIFRSDFGLFYQMPRNSGALYSVTRTLDVYVYQALMKNNDYSMSSAASVFQSVVGFILIIAANKLVKRYESNSALF